MRRHNFNGNCGNNNVLSGNAPWNERIGFGNNCGGCNDGCFPGGPNPPIEEVRLSPAQELIAAGRPGGGGNVPFIRGAAFADFYAVMPSDNPTTIPAGADVNFPQNGATSCTDITRTSSSSFNLACPGFYLVMFDVCAEEAGQLMLTLNGADLNYTVAGRGAATCQIEGMAIVQTTAANSIITVRNPLGSAAPMKVMELAGGVRPVTAHLVIIRIA